MDGGGDQLEQEQDDGAVGRQIVKGYCTAKLVVYSKRSPDATESGNPLMKQLAIPLVKLLI